MLSRRPAPRKLILRQYQSPGDIVMLTAAVRDLHLCYPGRFLTDVRTSAPALWENNPFLTPLEEGKAGVEVIDCHYPLVHRSNQEPYHFIHGFIHFLNERLKLRMRPTAFKGDIHISDLEKSWISQVREITAEDVPFWIVVAGGKNDYTIKWWDVARYQAVVDHFHGRVQFVQVGEQGHYHPTLERVIDLRGKTDLRQLVRLVYHAAGVVGPVSLLMHLAAAVEVKGGTPRNRACVVIAGGREPPHWEAYPHHQFIHTVGTLDCCDEGGCWKSRTVPLGDGDEKDSPENLCIDVVGSLPRCMDMIGAEEVIRRVELYLHHPRAEAMLTDLAPPVPAIAIDEELTEGNALAIAEEVIRRIPPYPGGYAGRGIVMCAGAEKYFTPAWVCINRLRRLGCSLPIQVWYLGEAELTERMRSLLEPLGVECIDAFSVRGTHPARILKGWELKPYAILHSPFREVLFIDADNVPVVNPEFLFDTPQYGTTGAIFWPDLGRLEPHRPIWTLCGVTYRDEPEFETGQLVVDKERCWRALSLCMWYNEHSDFYYRYVHGDKETFHLAFRKLAQAYAMPETGIQHLDGTYCQHDFQGRRIWQHRNGAKWTLTGSNHRVAGFVDEEECLTALEELRLVWSEGAGTRAVGAALPLPDFVDRVLRDARPLSQNTADGDLGFGWIYYGLIRNLRPDYVVAIGSCGGFMPFCAARAVQDNGRGHVIFIDPSYRGEGNPGWSGEGLWDEPEAVQARIADFHLDGWISHLKLTSEEALPWVKTMVGDATLGVVIVDGAHTHADSLRDYELYSELMREGFILFHDATNTNCDVSQTIQDLRVRRHPVVTIDRDAGLALVQVGSIPTVESRWDYLCRPSNRAELILPFVRELLRPADRVLEIYCGYSPLAYHLDDVELLGWDRDPVAIRKLRAELPHYRWEQIDELYLPFAEFLPEAVDVVIGLGVTSGRAAWEPQCVLPNLRYLLGRYYPRAVLLETAADYCDADVVDDAAANLVMLGYRCRHEVIQTDMASYATRKVLVAVR